MTIIITDQADKRITEPSGLTEMAALLFGSPCASAEDKIANLLEKVRTISKGVWVDQVSAVQLLAREHMDEAPDHILQNPEVLDAVYKDNHQFIHLLNLENLLDLDACGITGPGSHDPALV